MVVSKDDVGVWLVSNVVCSCKVKQVAICAEGFVEVTGRKLYAVWMWSCGKMVCVDVCGVAEDV